MRASIGGHLRVLAPLGFGRRYVVPAAARFCAEHPDVTLDLALSARIGRIPDTSWDVAVHIGALRDSSLVAHRLAPNERVVCAAPDYLARRGAPETPADLRAHACVALRENDEDGTLWRFRARAEAEPGSAAGWADVTGGGADAARQRAPIARCRGAAPTTVRVRPRLASNDGEGGRGRGRSRARASSCAPSGRSPPTCAPGGWSGCSPTTRSPAPTWSP